jgi:hypothetical protein
VVGAEDRAREEEERQHRQHPAGEAPGQQRGDRRERQREVVGLPLGEAERAGHVAEAVLEDQRAADRGGGPDEHEERRRAGRRESGERRHRIQPQNR